MRFNLFTRLSVLMVGAFILFACDGREVITDPLVMAPGTERSYTISEEGGMVSIEFTAKADWSATLVDQSASEWLAVLPSSGSAGDKKVLLQAAANENAEERVAVLRISCVNESFDIRINQKQLNSITLTSSRIDVEAEGGEFRIVLKTNVDFTYSIDEDASSWISYVTTKAFETRTLFFTVTPNEDLTRRQGSIIFKGAGKTETVRVIQAAARPAIIISDKERLVPSSGGIIEVDVASNVDVNVKIPTAASLWVSNPDTKAMNHSTVYLAISENENVEPRVARIPFTNKDTGASDTLKITQMQRNALVVADSSYVVSGYGDVLPIAVGHNIPFTASVDKDWVRQVVTKGFETDTLYFSIDPNDGYEIRGATITFLSDDRSLRQDIRLSQNHTKILELTPEIQCVASGGGNVEVKLRHNVPARQVEVDASWMSMVKSTVTDTLNVYTFRVQENQTYAERTAHLHVSDDSGKLHAYAEVSQIQNDGFYVENKSILVSWEENDAVIKVNTNVGVDFKDPQGAYWLRLSRTATKSLDEETIYLHLDENSDTRERRADIVITDACGKGFVDTIHVLQSPRMMYVFDYPEPFESIKENTVSVSFTAFSDWSVVDDTNGLLSYSLSSGEAGDVNLAVTVHADNFTNDYKTIEGHIMCGGYIQNIVFSQMPAFSIDGLSFSFGPVGGEESVKFTSYLPADCHVTIEGDESFIEMTTQSRPPSGLECRTPGQSIESHTGHVAFCISPNFTASDREGHFRLVSEVNGVQAYSVWCTVLQERGHFSSDYSQDGKVTVLQTHTKGAGVPIVLLGDAFTDVDVNEGRYDEAMREAYTYLFSREPMTSLQDLFDVYYVTAVSPTREFNGMTRFNTRFGGGTSISGDDTYCAQYATAALGEFNFDHVTIAVILNTRTYAGTCWMYTGDSGEGSGMSVAYVPMTDPDAYWMGFENVLHHEVIGHGFGKLADEYSYEYMGTISLIEKNSLREHHKTGMFRNVDLTSDVKASLWSQFAADETYAHEQLGAYEGAYTYYRGVYRPTYTSIMVDNVGIFNAPSRALIYKRAMSIAYRNEGWKFDYDEFVRFDVEVSKKEAVALKATASHSRSDVGYVPLASPVVVDKKVRIDK